MEQTFVKRVAPRRYMWCLLNNLETFNNRPEYIIDFIKRFKKVQNHPLMGPFKDIIASVEDFYHNNGKFQGIEQLRLDFKNVKSIETSNDKFSMQIYESLIRFMDQEALRQEINEKIVEPEQIDVDDCRRLAKEISRYADSSVSMPEQTKEMLLNSYRDYAASFDGVKTHIKPIDDIIGVLGYQSLSVFAAPSGHGKSTFAQSVAYYVACSGMCVDYLSFEIPWNNAWFNMVSIESEGKHHPLPASKIKCAELNEEEQKDYYMHMTNLLNRIKENNGFLNIVDQTTVGAGSNTFEGLCAALETIAEKRKRKADLIVVDNVDNLQILKSSEKDEATKVNNCIIGLDAFSKRYCDGAGAAILLLSQVNRPAMKRLYTSANDDSKSSKIDVTCIQKYNALYEKPTCVLVGFADEAARASGIMRVHPVKLRNKPVPEHPIKVSVSYAFSKVKGDFMTSRFENQQEYQNTARGCFDRTADFEVEDIEDEKPPMSSLSSENEALIDKILEFDDD